MLYSACSLMVGIGGTGRGEEIGREVYALLPGPEDHTQSQQVHVPHTCKRLVDGSTRPLCCTVPGGMGNERLD